MITYLQSVIQGIVEGVTEFLPISSTGHLIVSSAALHMPDDETNKAFSIVIQLGAIIAVIWYYRAELLDQLRRVVNEPIVRRLWLNLFIAFCPVAGVGFLFHHWITDHLFSPRVVAGSLIVGGLILMLVDRDGDRDDGGDERTIRDIYDIMPRHAAIIGLAQILSLVPGTSRSGATIVGGMLTGLTREAATKFSFFLAIPTLGIATIYEGLKERHAILQSSNLVPFAIGTFVSFLVALVAIGWLLKFVSRHSFFGFGVYRIVAGLAVLGLAYSGFLG